MQNAYLQTQQEVEQALQRVAKSFPRGSHLSDLRHAISTTDPSGDYQDQTKRPEPATGRQTNPIVTTNNGS